MISRSPAIDPESARLMQNRLHSANVELGVETWNLAVTIE